MFDEKKWLEECKVKMAEEGKNNPNAIGGFVNGQCIFGKDNFKEIELNEFEAKHS